LRNADRVFYKILPIPKINSIEKRKEPMRQSVSVLSVLKHFVHILRGHTVPLFKGAAEIEGVCVAYRSGNFSDGIEGGAVYQRLCAGEPFFYNIGFRRSPEACMKKLAEICVGNAAETVCSRQPYG